MKLGGLEMWDFFFSSDVSLVVFSKSDIVQHSFSLGLWNYFSHFDKGRRILPLFYLALFYIIFYFKKAILQCLQCTSIFYCVMPSQSLGGMRGECMYYIIYN